MEFVNERIKEKTRLFSLARLLSTLSMPNIYLAESLEDFIDARNTVHGTPKYAFLRPARSYGGTAIAVIPHSRYRKTAEPDYEECLAAKREKVSRFKAEAMKRLEQVSPEGYAQYKMEIKASALAIEREFSASLNNAELYVGDTSFPIRSPFAVPEDGYLLLVQLRYDPQLDHAILEYCFTPTHFFIPRPPSGGRLDRSLLDRLKDVYPSLPLPVPVPV